jgi:PAS domain S-box-containing protein
MLGYSKDELHRLSYKEYTHPKDIPTSARHFKELAEGTRDAYTREKRYIRKDGRLVWGQVTVSMLRDAGGEPQFTMVMTEDITQRKQAEEEIRTYQGKLQVLASELSLTEERERRRLATDLHDHIGQALAISKIKLGILQKSVTSEIMAQPLSEVRELIEKMIQDTRSLTFELSLPVLYELGFEAAVEWFARYVRSHHGIQMDVQKDLKPIPMDDEIKVLLFRFVRELMMNVVKHAQARRARVIISRNGEEVTIKVEDDGVGFGPLAQYQTISSNGGFGLFSIRERLHYLGGRLEVESTDIEGTRVTLMVPLKHDRKTLEG